MTARYAARGSRDAKAYARDERNRARLIDQGALSWYQQIREQALAESYVCPHCAAEGRFQRVHPSNTDKHNALYHAAKPLTPATETRQVGSQSADQGRGEGEHTATKAAPQGAGQPPLPPIGIMTHTPTPGPFYWWNRRGERVMQPSWI